MRMGGRVYSRTGDGLKSGARNGYGTKVGHETGMDMTLCLCMSLKTGDEHVDGARLDASDGNVNGDGNVDGNGDGYGSLTGDKDQNSNNCLQNSFYYYTLYQVANDVPRQSHFHRIFF